MPDHIHLLLTPGPEISLEKTMQFIKGGFSFRLKSKLDVWERSYTNHRIADSRDYATHVIYIRENPVRSKITPHAELFPHSSANPIHPSDPTPNHFA